MYRATEMFPGQLVLVRDTPDEKWDIRFFHHYEKDSRYIFHTMDNGRWVFCVPYDGNEHLFQTSTPYEGEWEPTVGELCAFQVGANWVPGFFVKSVKNGNLKYIKDANNSDVVEWVHMYIEHIGDTENHVATDCEPAYKYFKITKPVFEVF